MYQLKILINFFWYRDAYAAAEDDVEVDSSDEETVPDMTFIFETYDDEITVGKIFQSYSSFFK